MGRKILFVTTDQQRYDTLGCNGGTIARPPGGGRPAAEAIRYERAVPQSVVCMPSRSTILTGQHPTTHGVWMNGVPLPPDAPSFAQLLHQAGDAHPPPARGVWMNGVPLPPDAPSFAQLLHQAGYRTALIGKAHFEPYFDPFMRFTENALAATGTTPSAGTHRGFEHPRAATPGAEGGTQP